MPLNQYIFPSAANKISAIVSSLILGSHGFSFDASQNDVREYVPSGRRIVGTLEQGFFFDRWEAKIANGIDEGQVDEWFTDWSREFAPWVIANNEISITGTGKQRELIDKDFDSIITEKWSAVWQVRRLAFMPVLIWAERYEWFDELCHRLDVTSFEY